MTTNKIKSKAAMMMLLILALCALTTTVLAQTVVTTQTYDRVKYTLWSDGTASVEPSPNAYGTLNLRETITYENNNYTLTRIADNAFANRTSLTGSLSIPNTVTDIGNNAFDGCTGLTGTLTLPTALQHIGSGAFSNCGFTGALNLPDGLTSIESSAFYQCSFTGTLTLSPLLTVIEPLVFFGCKFTGELIIPEGVTSIGWDSFYANHLSSVTIGDNVTTIDRRAFWGKPIHVVLGRNVSSIGDNAFRYTGDDTRELSLECRGAIPPTLGESVFEGHNFSWYFTTVPCGTKDTYFNAWYNSGFSELSFTDAPWQNVCVDGVYYQLVCDGHTAKVMNSAFLESSQGASYSGDVVIADAVEYEGITYRVTQVAPYAFYFCQSVTSVTFGSNMQSIGDYAFGWCTGINSLIFQSDTPPTFNFYNAFNNAFQQRTAIVPCGALSVYQATDWGVVCNGFEEMPIKVHVGDLFYEIPCNGVTATVVFDESYLSFTSVMIDETVKFNETDYPITAIGDGAFDGCTGIQYVDCHGNLAYIGVNAFRGCTGFADFEYTPYMGFYKTPTPPIVGEGAFEDVPLEMMSLTVPFCSQYDYSQHEVFGQFSAYEGYGNCDYNFTNQNGDGLWSNPANWIDANMEVCTEAPGAGARVGIFGDCEIDSDVTVGGVTINHYCDEYYGLYERLTVKDGATLTATNFIYTTGDERNFVIEDGAQVIHPNAGAKATVEKNITAYTPGTKNGWHLISSPATESFAPSADNGFLANEYDLYYYHEPTHHWRNHKQGSNNADSGFDIEPLTGYLYANSQDVTLGLKGTLEAGNAMVNNPLSYASIDGKLMGFNLVGNPFAHNVTAFAGTNVADEVYRMNGNRSDLTVSPINSENPLLPGEGFFVKATDAEASITFNNSRATNAERSYIALELSENDKLIDRFILKKDGHPLEKFTLRENGTKIYATKEAQDWAVVTMEGKEQALNFKAEKNGTYTLAVNVENMDFDYLHLIDNLTGADIDLLTPAGTSPSQRGPGGVYTFTAKTTDYTSRFRLVFNANDASIGTASDTPFAYINNGNIIINDADARGASLQIVDMMGRVIASYGGHGHTRCVPTNGMAPGVYILRLINGNDVRVQKIVLE